MLLRPDDWEVGMYVTLIRGRLREPMHSEMSVVGFDSGRPVVAPLTVPATYHESGQGYVLKVIAVDLPVVITDYLDSYGGYSVRIMWNVNQNQFKRVKPEIVREMRKDLARKPA